MPTQSKQSTKKNILSTEEMPVEKSEAATEKIVKEDATKVDPESSDSESEYESESDDLDDMLDKQDKDEDEESEDEMSKALSSAIKKNDREIRGFATLVEKVWYEIRYITKEYDSPRFKETKVRVLVIQDSK